MNEIRLTASVTLIGAGLLAVAAGYERWWPECRPGQIDTRACEILQDHLYDYAPPIAPFEAVGGAVWLQGFSYLFLAAALCLIAAMVERSRILGATYCFGAVCAGLAGGITFWAAGMGEGLAADGAARWLLGVIVATLVLLVPLACLWSAVVAQRNSDRVMYVAIAAASPLIEMILAPIVVGGWSYDTAAWSGAVSGWLVVASGLACAAGIRRTTAQPTAVDVVNA